MIFRTASTTEYVLENVVDDEWGFKGEISRISEHPLVDWSTGRDDVHSNTDKTFDVMFKLMPEVGSRFEYWHPVWGGCVSTVVTEILED